MANQKPIFPITPQQPKKPLVTKTFMIVFALVILLPVGLVGGFGLQCKIRQLSVKNAHKDTINAFEQIKLTSTDTTATKVYLGGDCVDSEPYINVDKQVPINLSASAAIDDIRQTLTSQKFTLSDESISENVGFNNYNCGYSYGAVATNNNISFKIWFETSRQSHQSNCEVSDSVKVKQGDVTTEPVNTIHARLNT